MVWNKGTGLCIHCSGEILVAKGGLCPGTIDVTDRSKVNVS